MNDERPKVLIVEDSPGHRRVLQRAFERAGYVVEYAENGEDALQHMRSSVPDILIVDLIMPRMDGIQLCKIIRKTPGIADLPLIMLTVAGSSGYMSEGIRAGADRYLVKASAPAEEVVAHADALLRRRPRNGASSPQRTPENGEEEEEEDEEDNGFLAVDGLDEEGQIRLQEAIRCMDEQDYLGAYHLFRELRDLYPRSNGLQVYLTATRNCIRKRANQLLGPRENILELLKGDAPAGVLTTEEGYLLSRLRHPMTIQDALRESGMDHVVALHGLCRLQELGLIRSKAPQRKRDNGSPHTRR